MIFVATDVLWNSNYDIETSEQVNRDIRVQLTDSCRRRMIDRREQRSISLRRKFKGRMKRWRTVAGNFNRDMVCINRRLLGANQVVERRQRPRRTLFTISKASSSVERIASPTAFFAALCCWR
jgi:hypothetical protein